jgi:16S rRNA processing protein RimM
MSDPASVDGLLEVGRVGKPHGLGGEVAVDLITNRVERLSAGSHLVGVRPGESRPISLVVERARPHVGRYLVTFVGVDDRSGAEAIRNATLFAEPTRSDEDLFVHDLIGARVIDASGIDRGTVTAVEANPASDLLVLDSGALVPMRFVTTFDGGVLTVEVPEGLFE